MATIELKKQDRNVEIEVEKRIQNEDTQKRYYVAELIKRALNQYLDYDDLKADSRYSAYTMPIINETLDVIDFEINSLNVHVIPTIDKTKNQNVYIPKSYKIYNCKPDMIIFVNFTKGLTKMSIEGFITDINLNTLAIAKSSLRPVEALIDALKTGTPKTHSAEENVVKTAKELMLAYIDSSLSEEGEHFFLKHFLSSKEIRKNYKLFYALNCSFISVAKKHKSLSDETFVSIDSAPETNEEMYAEEESQINIPVQLADTPSVSDFALQDDVVKLAESEETQDALQSTFDDMADTLGTLEDISEPEIFDIADNEPIELLTEDNNEESDTNTLEENDTQMSEDLNLTETASEDSSLQEMDELSDANMTELDFTSFDEDDGLDLSNEEEDISLSEPPEEEPPAEQKILLQESVAPQDNPVEPIANEQPAQEETTVEPINIETEENTEISGDDVFSFLSEMADEAQEQEVIEEEPSTPPQMQDEGSEFAATLQEQAQEESVLSEQIQEESIPIENIGGGATLNDAFAPQAGQPFSEEPPVSEPQEQQQDAAVKPKSNLGTVLLLGTFIAVAGLGIYFYRDYIPFLNNSTEMQGLTEEKGEEKMPELPTPIDSTAKLDENAPSDATADGTTAPPPTAAAPAPTVPAAVPPATNKQTDTDSAIPSLPKTVEPPKPKHLNDAIATALTKDFSGVRISKVSWEISETLVNNSDVKRYLTIAGKSIKNTLSQDLLAATEPSFKDVVIADIVYKKDGSVSNVKISSSSGSSQIDDIVVKSIKDTLNYIKMPALNINKPEYTAKLVVRL